MKDSNAKIIRISNGAAQTAQVPIPSENERIPLVPPSQGELLLGFSPDSASGSRNGNNLVLTLEHGGSVELVDFFVAEPGSLPSFVFPDGARVSADELLASFNIIPVPAMVPEISSGGFGEYNDASGELVGGIDRLGALDSFADTPGSPAGEVPASGSANAGFSADFRKGSSSGAGETPGDGSNLGSGTDPDEGGTTDPGDETDPDEGGTTDPGDGTDPDEGGTTDPGDETDPDEGGTTDPGDETDPDEGGTTDPGDETDPDEGGTTDPGDETDPDEGGTTDPGDETDPDEGGTTDPGDETDPDEGGTTDPGDETDPDEGGTTDPGDETDPDEGGTTDPGDGNSGEGGVKGVDNDTITLVGLGTLYGNTVYGDSAAVLNKWHGGEGDQVYTDDSAGSLQIYVGGKNTADSSYWGDDRITLQSNRVDSNTIHGGQGDDAITFESASGTHFSYANTIYGDEAALHGGLVAGNDTIIIKGDSQGNTIKGDGHIASNLNGPTILGDDTVEIHGNSAGESYFGDVYDALSGVTLGNDRYVVTGDSTGSSLYGDAYYLRGNNKAGDDLIRIGGNSTGESIYGDGYSLGANVRAGNDEIYIGGDSFGNTMYGDGFSLGNGSVGGNDTITIAGAMNGGFIRGDSEGSGSNVRFGDDVITVGSIAGATSKRDSAVIAGDSESSGANAVFGDDTIIVGDMTNATIKGDSTSGGLGAQFGNDTIIVNGTVTNGWIIGDAETAGASSQKLGNDYIEVDTFASGRIYGDSANNSSAVAGNDTIVVHNLTGTGSKLIDGGAGGLDLFIYDNEEGHSLLLDDSGQVFIDGEAGYRNASIVNFEGIGGGSGDDVITGNSAGNVLIGGAGNDRLTGGGGADVFVWRPEDMAKNENGFADIITDFSADDTIDLSALGLHESDIHAASNGNDLTLNFSVGGGSQTIVIENGMNLSAGHGGDADSAMRELLATMQILLNT